MRLYCYSLRVFHVMSQGLTRDCTTSYLTVHQHACFMEISRECTEIHIIDDISEKTVTIELDIELCVKLTTYVPLK